MISETGGIDEELFTSKVKENKESTEKKEEEKKPKLDLPQATNSGLATVDKMSVKVSQIKLGQFSFDLNPEGMTEFVKKLKETFKTGNKELIKDIRPALESLQNINFLYMISKEMLADGDRESRIAVRQTLNQLDVRTQAKLFCYAEDNNDKELTVQNIFDNAGLNPQQIENLFPDEDTDALQAQISRLKLSDRSGIIAVGGNGYASQRDILIFDKLLTALDPQADTSAILDVLFQISDDGQKYLFADNFLKKVRESGVNEDAQKLMMIYWLAENKIYLSEDDLAKPAEQVEEKISLITKHIQTTGDVFVLDNLPESWQTEIEDRIVGHDFDEKGIVNVLMNSKTLIGIYHQAKKNDEDLLGQVINVIDRFKRMPFIGNFFNDLNVASVLIRVRKGVRAMDQKLTGVKETAHSMKNSVLKAVGQNPELRDSLSAIETTMNLLQQAELDFASGKINQDTLERRIEYVIDQLSKINQALPETIDEKPRQLTTAFVGVREMIEKNDLKINTLAFTILNSFLTSVDEQLLSESYAVQTEVIDQDKTQSSQQTQQDISEVLNDFGNRYDFSAIIQVLRADIIRRQEAAERVLNERLEFDKEIEKKIKKLQEAVKKLEKIAEIINELLVQIDKNQLVNLVANITAFTNLVDNDQDLPDRVKELLIELEELKLKMRERFPELFV